MAKDDSTNFICPGCQARYKVVRAKSESRAADWSLHCKVCKQPLAATEGEDVLKYFLISRPKQKQPQTPERNDQPRSASKPPPRSPAPRSSSPVAQSPER